MLLLWVSHVVLVSFFCFSVDQFINWHNISFAILGIDFFLHTSLSYIVIDVILHASKPQFRRDHIVVVRPFQKNGECHCERVLDFAICFCFAAVPSFPVNTARGVFSFGKKNGIRDVSFVFRACRLFFARVALFLWALVCIAFLWLVGLKMLTGVTRHLLDVK